MGEVKRIFPGTVNGLINWLEENFHNIDEYIVAVKCKDGSLMTVYDVRSYLMGLGMMESAKDTLNTLDREGEFTPKED